MTVQLEQWAGNFGREYTDRNFLSPEALDSVYRKQYGVTRSQLNAVVLSGVPADARILEVGCNLGNQLLLLRQMGFRDLYGVEVQQYALEKARARVPKARLSQGTAFDLPFPDGYFDLVFTSGVLIHIAPSDLPRAMAEIRRCTRSCIWGLEYYAAQPTQVEYRGHEGLLWKMDYVRVYLDLFADLEPLLREYLRYERSDNVDCMFLLGKQTEHERA